MNHPHPRRRPAKAWSTRAALAGVAAVFAACSLPATVTHEADPGPGDNPIVVPSGELPPPPALKAAMDKIVADGVPGVVVRVRQGNDVTTLVSGNGTKATPPGAGVPAGPGDHFRIASQTKPFVATVVLQLVAEGKLKLNDRVDRLLPRTLPLGTAVTVEQVLQHTSGLKDYLNDARRARLSAVTKPVLEPYFGKGDVNHVWTPEQLVAMAPRSVPTTIVTRHQFHYSNTNYVLAGMLIEKITGNPPGVEIKRRILDPLGLKETSFPTTSITMPEPYLHGYEYDVPARKWPDGDDFTRLSPSIFAGSGAMVSTVADLGTFFRNLVSPNGTLLKQPQRTAMQKVVRADRASSYGLGIEQFRTDCGTAGTNTAWGHNGSAFGYASQTMVTADGSRETEIVLNRNWSDIKKLDDDWETLVGLAICGEGGKPLATSDLGETRLADDAVESPDPTPPTDDGARPGDAGTPTTDDGSQPGDPGTPPGEEGTPPADDGTPPAYTGNRPTDEGNPPADDARQPADSDN